VRLFFFRGVVRPILPIKERPCTCWSEWFPFFLDELMSIMFFGCASLSSPHVPCGEEAPPPPPTPPPPNCEPLASEGGTSPLFRRKEKGLFFAGVAYLWLTFSRDGRRRCGRRFLLVRD